MTPETRDHVLDTSAAILGVIAFILVLALATSCSFTVVHIEKHEAPARPTPTAAPAEAS